MSNKPCYQTAIPPDNNPIPCNGEYLSTECVLHPQAIVELDLPQNSSVEDIITAINNALINLNNQGGGGSGESVVSGSVQGNDLVLVKTDSTQVVVDVSALYDNTNLSRVTSATLSGTTLILTRNDSSTVQANLSSLLNTQDADEVPFATYLSLTSNNVQDAIEELKDEVDQISSGGVSDGDKGHINVSGGGAVWTLDDNVVGTTKIIDLAVTTAKLEDGAVTNAKITNNTIQFAKLVQVSQGSILGRADASGTGNINELTAEQVRTIINVEDGATADQTATQVPITDAGNYFSSSNVEGALQELGAATVGSGSRSYVDSTGNGLTGTQNGSNTVFTISQSAYDSGSLLVFIGGFPMSAGNGITETNPSNGTFTFDFAPESTATIIVQYSN